MQNRVQNIRLGCASGIFTNKMEFLDFGVAPPHPSTAYLKPRCFLFYMNITKNNLSIQIGIIGL